MKRREVIGWLGGALASPFLLRHAKARAEAYREPISLDHLYPYQEVRGEMLSLYPTEVRHRITRRLMPGTLVVEVASDTGGQYPEVFMRVAFDCAGKPDYILVGGSGGIEDTLVDEARSVLSDNRLRLVLAKGRFPKGAYATASYDYNIEALPPY